jgi:hypothetical protein
VGVKGAVVGVERVDGAAVVRVDTGGGVVATCEQALPPGCDALPLTGDTVILERLPGAGRWAVVGYAGPGDAEPGDAILVSRPGGARVACLADGSVEVTNAAGSMRMLPDGSVDINGGTIDLTGDYISPLGVRFSTHVHAAPGGTTSGPTSPPAP